MPKSTPLSQLRNRNQPAAPQVQAPPQAPPQMDEQNENELVNEILREIDETEQVPDMQPQASYSNQEYAYPIPEQNPYYNQQPPAHYQEHQEVEEEPELTLFEELKNHLYVGLIVLVLSFPQVSDLITKFMPNKDIIQNNLNYVIMLVKALLGAVLSFVINNFL